MSLQQHISNLLYTHDCIIIPGFGGFVANRKPAFLNPAHHTFAPPAKKIAFNSSLRISDGLLANHVSKEVGVSYKEAGELIDHFVKDCMLTLSNGERLVIDKVGVLFYDAEKNLQFVPDNAVNYLKDSFGLTTLHSPAIKRDEDARRTMHPIMSHKNVQRVRNLKSWRLMEIIPAAAVLAWLMLSPPVLTNLNFNSGNLNPFAQPKIIVHKPKAEKVEVKYSYFKQEENKAETTIQTADSVVSSATKEVQPTKTPAEELLATPVIIAPEAVAKNEVEWATTTPVEKNIAEPISTEVHRTSINSVQKLSYVIGGCFREYANAVNFRDEALADGFQAAIIGQNDKGLHMVSLFSSTETKRAFTEMALIKEKFQPQAWMFRK